MTGKALICKLGELEPIEGADRIAQVHMFGETVIVSKDYNKGDLGLLFDCDTQLSHEYCHYNNLYRHSNLNANKEESGYIEDNRRIRPIRLKGVKCSGMWMPIKSLFPLSPQSLGTEHTLKAQVGSEIDEINGIQICQKYVTKKTKQAQGKQGKPRENITPTFKEHFDTDQWARNTHVPQEGDLVYITEKLHGTSFRCGKLPVIQKTWYLSIITFILKFFFGKTWTPNSSLFVVGSRRVVKSIEGEEHGNKDHYYNEDLWTEVCTREFKGKLRKGETIYGEIVGFTPNGQPIMGSHNNSKLKNFMSKDEYKQFIERYGETTEFTYGCSRSNVKAAKELRDAGVKFDSQILDDQLLSFPSFSNLNKVFVYRITMTNDDGDTIDLSWEQVKARCQQLEVEHVPELEKFIVTPFRKESHDEPGATVDYLADHYGTSIEELVDKHTESDSTNFPQHLNEGVCVRIENGALTPKVYKSKRYLFKVLEGIIKDTDQVDIEEAN